MPSTTFAPIGASYETNHISDITVRPNEVIIEKLEEIIAQCRDNIGNLINMEMSQKWAGVVQFVASFVQDGRFLVNSLYSGLAASKHILYHRDMVRVSDEIYRDLHTLLDYLRRTQAKIGRLQHNMGRGAAGILTDETAPKRMDGRGWGVVAGNTFDRGDWPDPICKAVREGRLSINELELITVVAGLRIGTRERVVQSNGDRFVVRRDNVNYIVALNRWRAKGHVMRPAIRAGFNVCKSYRTRVWGYHIAGADNTDADGLSRGESYADEVTKRGYRRDDQPIEMNEWIADIISSAQYNIIAGEEENSIDGVKASGTPWLV